VLLYQQRLAEVCKALKTQVSKGRNWRVVQVENLFELFASLRRTAAESARRTVGDPTASRWSGYSAILLRNRLQILIARERNWQIRPRARFLSFYVSEVDT
jgi:hypothetical protein